MRPLLRNKRGSVIDLMIFIVMSFVIVMFFALWVYAFGVTSDTLVAIESSDPLVNVSNAASETFAKVNIAQQRMVPIIAYIMIFGMALTILVSNFLVKAHPAFFIVYLMVTIAAFIASAYVSNQYELFMLNDIIGPTLNQWKGASFILLNLPIWVAVIGIFGAIFLFSGIIRDREQGGGIS